MAKVITQDTFDDVVKENIVEFSMSPDEAQEETTQQFEAQGINLNNIVKDLKRNPITGAPCINEIIDELKKITNEAQQSELDTQKLLSYLRDVEEECNKSLAHRVLVGKHGAQDALVKLLERQVERESPDMELVACCLRTLKSLTNHQPDIFDSAALAVAMKLLAMAGAGVDVRSLTLQWVQKACIMHETNRTNIMAAGILQQLKPLVVAGQNETLLRDILALFRYLVLDDDIRVEFGNAHEHARLIASEVIVHLTELLNAYDDEAVLADLILTIGTLAVRQEFCTTIEDAGGLKFLIQIMSAHKESIRMNRESLKLLRALAGNDLVKVHIVQQGVAPIIKEILRLHQNNESIATAALACVSTLTLRVTQNSAAFFETGIAEEIAETILRHPNNKIIQRNGAWTIRNMVSRSREQCGTWLSYNIEEALNSAMKAHPSIAQDVKAALRDLGCQVSFKEEWTGVAEKKIMKDY